MAITAIPTQQNLGAWTQRTTLDGVDYLLDFVWNARDPAWFVSISSIDGTELVNGIKLVSNWPLLRTHRYINGLPPGELIAVDLSGSIDKAGYGDLSNGVKLTYFDVAELVAAGRA